MAVHIMPNVFVIPPEEDNQPPFCYFDAADPLEHYIPTEEDLEGPGSALDIFSQQISSNSPVFHRDGRTNGVIMPRRSDGRSMEDVLTGDDDEYQDPDKSTNSLEDDSEIIEIIKVRRHSRIEGNILQPSSISEPTLKSSRSFKFQASRAFNSIKKVGRSVSRSRIYPDASESNSSRAPSPSMRSASTTILTSLFRHSPSLESRSSFDSLPESSSTEHSPPNPLDLHLHSPSSVEMQGFVPVSYPDTDEEDDGTEENLQATPRVKQHPPDERPPSPISISRAPRRRFSIRNLLSASRDSESSDAGSSVMTSTSTPNLPSRTDSSDTSSSSGPATPVDDAFPDPLPARPSTSSLLRRLPSFSRSTGKSKIALAAVAKPTVLPRSAPAVAGKDDLEDDLSYGEMRLDSFHFDDLSFDASQF